MGMSLGSATTFPPVAAKRAAVRSADSTFQFGSYGNTVVSTYASSLTQVSTSPSSRRYADQMAMPPASDTTPDDPSTVTRSPSERRRVASPVARTAGMPYSRAMTAVCDSTPPPSVTTAPDRRNSTDHGGDVVGATSTSPGRNLANSVSSRMTRTVPE